MTDAVIHDIFIHPPYRRCFCIAPGFSRYIMTINGEIWDRNKLTKVKPRINIQYPECRSMDIIRLVNDTGKPTRMYSGLFMAIVSIQKR